MQVRELSCASLGMWIAKNKFTEAAKSIFALCDGITVTNKMDGSPAMSISLSHGTYSVEPFPPKGEVDFHVEDTFSTRTLSRLIVCFIGLGKRDLANVSQSASEGSLTQTKSIESRG
ncbi:unnamed protein product [Cylicostephanus goldi]|uniref:Uncharacterized protein n=1 Tax=Cylicostephanus goldi TaxID=71465 RepID=A0A3P7MKP2_CYLGO|nr:unnamed protein product [Cylicostephanus goldi]